MGRYRTSSLLGTVMLLAMAATSGWAQEGTGSLTGKLTDLHSKPLGGASMVARNVATGAEARTITSKNGNYQFSGLEPGEYAIEAKAADLRRGRLEGIVVAAGREARVQAAMDLVPAVDVDAAQLAKPERPEIQVRDTSAIADALRFLERARLGSADSIESEREKVESPVIAEERAWALLIPPTDRLSAHLPVVVPAVAAGTVHHVVPAAKLVALASLTAVRYAAADRSVRASISTDEAASLVIDGLELESLPLADGRVQNVVLASPPSAGEDDEENHTAVSRASERMGGTTMEGADIRLAFAGSGAGRFREGSAALIGPGATETVIRRMQAGSEGAESSTARGFGGTNGELQQGGDSFHGRASLFVRQNLWGAQNPFTEWVQPISQVNEAFPTFAGRPVTPGDRATTWGVAAGGRVGKSRFRWYGAWDNALRNDPGISTVRHPDSFFAQPSNDQAHVLSARLRLSNADPVTEGLGAYAGILQTLDGLLGPAARTSTQWTGFGRVDWTPSARNQFTMEGTDALRAAPGGGFTRASEMYGTHSYGASHMGEQWLMGRWQTLLAGNLVLALQGSFGHHVVTHAAAAPSPFEQSLNINAWGQLPQMVVDSRNGFTIGNPARFGPGAYPDERMMQVQNRASWVHGSVRVNAGMELGHNTDTTSFLRNRTGTYHYSNVENFVSDALTFAAFGINGQLDSRDQHNCDATGKTWRDTQGQLHGLGFLPCYSYYTQSMGPSNWWLSTNDWAGFVSTQWHPGKAIALSMAMRWEQEQTPPPIALVENPDLPLAGKMPSLGNEWGPRAGIAWGKTGGRWPVLRLGYGMVFGRTPNATLETVLTQTGSSKGNLNFFLRPTDNLNAGGAPPFPYVLAGEPGNGVKSKAVELAPGFSNGEAQQAVAEIEETLPGHVHLSASGVISLGRRLPVTLDANVDPAVNPRTITYAIADGNASGPIKSAQVTLPFYASLPDAATGNSGRLNPKYQQILEVMSRANSTYEAAVFRLSRNSFKGLTLHARYTFAHAADWNPDESTTLSNASVFDPAHFGEEYGISDLDVRHSASAAVIWDPHWKMRAWAGRVGNGWKVSGIGSFSGGSPFTMRTAGSLAKEFDVNGNAIVALAPGINGYGGDNRIYGVGRNTFRYPATWKADMRLSKGFNLGEMRQVEILAESFNLMNHRNVTELETVGYSIESGSPNGGLPTLNFLTGLKTGQTEFGQPLNANATDFYRPRQFQFGVKLKF